MQVHTIGAGEMMMRVSPGESEKANEVVFGPRAWGGPEVARNLGVKHSTLWAWMNRSGLPMEVAVPLRDELLRRATELMEAAEGLQVAIQKARRNGAK
jgi:hypothetical protein